MTAAVMGEPDGIGEVLGAAWLDGTLHLRLAAIAPNAPVFDTLELTHTVTGETVRYPVALRRPRVVRGVPVGEPSLEVRIAPVALKGVDLPPLSAGTWTASIGSHLVRWPLPPRAALVQSTPVVAAAREGLLTLAVGRAANLFDGGRVSLDECEVTPSATGSRQATVRVPLDGVVPFGTKSITGKAHLATLGSVAHRALRAGLGRLGIDRRRTDVARYVVEDGRVWLVADVVVPRGRWRLDLTFRDRRWATPLELHKPQTASLPELAHTPGALGTPARRRPSTVTVVIPAYNAESCVGDAIASLLRQTIDRSRIEIIVVDDGSTDRTLDLLRRIAADVPQLTVLTRPNSGSCGAPRNMALEQASGDYVFFLDADDWLTPFALERLLDVADGFDADVVAGKQVGLGGRKPPQAAFRVSTVDATFEDNHLIYALGSCKLFRRAHIEALGLRFPEGRCRGEDQPFVLEAELAARRVAVLGDAPFHMTRFIPESDHLSLAAFNLEDRLATVALVADVIERYTEHGPLRDLLAVRLWGDGGVGPLVEAEHSAARGTRTGTDVAEWIRATLGPFWTPGGRDRMGTPSRIRTRDLLDGIIG